MAGKLNFVAQQQPPSGQRPTRGATGVERFWLLDNLRGLASLSVVFWHYQLFYSVAPDVLRPGFSPAEQPFFRLFAPFYLYGYHAVYLFFVLSGFVFFFVYYDPVRGGRTTGFEFFIARFSRLYPLHIVTLLIVAGGQWLSVLLTAQFFVIPYNDAYHFFLHCIFASYWGQGGSFNGPTWSVSVEVLLYCLFFFYARLITRYSSLHLGNAFVACVVLYTLGGFLYAMEGFAPERLAGFFYAAACFFAGGVIFLLWKKSSRQNQLTLVCLFAASVITSSLGLILFIMNTNKLVLHFVSFPAMVLSLALAQSLFEYAGRRLRVIGDVSYAVYLTHFPLQLIIIVYLTYYSVTVDFDQPAVLIMFLAVLLCISIVTFYYFEKPTQEYIRRKMLRGRYTAAQTPLASSASPQAASFLARVAPLEPLRDSEKNPTNAASLTRGPNS